MKLGIIAGNRLFPVNLAQNIKRHHPDAYLVALCFKGETDARIKSHVDEIHWLRTGDLKKLKEKVSQAAITDWVMAGQISPYRLFQKRLWDEDLTRLLAALKDARPHTIFTAIINYLEETGARFIDSTHYLKDELAYAGMMNKTPLCEHIARDIDFGTKLIANFVELDIGQTIVVKQKSVVAAEALEGTDNTIRRAARLAGKEVSVFKFSKLHQDLRFDVPIVGLNTLKLLKKIRAGALVLEAKKVLILEKEKFLTRATEWRIPVMGIERVKSSL